MYHALDIIPELDFDQYSAIVVSGGDGTIHEVISAMLHRPDKKTLPIGIIPNGTGNDLSYSFSIKEDIQRAL